MCSCMACLLCIWKHSKTKQNSITAAYMRASTAVMYGVAKHSGLMAHNGGDVHFNWKLLLFKSISQRCKFHHRSACSSVFTTECANFCVAEVLARDHNFDSHHQKWQIQIACICALCSHLNIYTDKCCHGNRVHLCLLCGAHTLRNSHLCFRQREMLLCMIIIQYFSDKQSITVRYVVYTFVDTQAGK